MLSVSSRSCKQSREPQALAPLARVTGGTTLLALRAQFGTNPQTTLRPTPPPTSIYNRDLRKLTLQRQHRPRPRCSHVTANARWLLHMGGRQQPPSASPVSAGPHNIVSNATVNTVSKSGLVFEHPQVKRGRGPAIKVRGAGVDNRREHQTTIEVPEAIGPPTGLRKCCWAGGNPPVAHCPWQQERTNSSCEATLNLCLARVAKSRRDTTDHGLLRAAVQMPTLARSGNDNAKPLETTHALEDDLSARNTMSAAFSLAGQLPTTWLKHKRELLPHFSKPHWPTTP